MPGAYPTWAKWVGQAHLAHSLPQQPLLESRLHSYGFTVASCSNPKRKAFWEDLLVSASSLGLFAEFFNAGPGALSAKKKALLLMIFIGVG